MTSASGDLDAHVDLAPDMLTVRDQGPYRGTCLAFATTAAHEQARMRRRGETSPELSVEVLYWRCKQLDGRPDEQGSNFASAQHALHDPGQPAEALWPYDPDRDQTAAAYTPPGRALEPAVLRRATLTRLSLDVDAIREALSDRRVVVAGVELWSAFYDCDSADLTPPAGDLDGAGHVICFVGYDDARGALKVRNSWGTGWGDAGYSWMPYDALAEILLEAWVAIDDLDAS